MYIVLRGIVSVEARLNLFVFAYKRRTMHRYTFHVELTRSILSLEKAFRQTRSSLFLRSKQRSGNLAILLSRNGNLCQNRGLLNLTSFHPKSWKLAISTRCHCDRIIRDILENHGTPRTFTHVNSAKS